MTNDDMEEGSPRGGCGMGTGAHSLTSGWAALEGGARGGLEDQRVGLADSGGQGEGGETARLPPARGRGTSLAPTNRFERLSLHVLPSHAQEIWAELPQGRRIKTLVYADATKGVINPVDSPDLSFSWTINPYRGCEHGCIYCYARPGHEYLAMSSGLDFETKIVAKHDAAALLRQELLRPGWKGERIVLSGVTDPYQPVERELRITRGILEVCCEFRQPVSIITKSGLVLRDLDLLEQLHRWGAVTCAVSLTSLDSRLAAKMEPRAASPGTRLQVIRTLSSMGIPVTVMTAPIIPRINDHELPALLAAAAEAGAKRAGYVLLRLPHQIKALFLDWLAVHFPERASHVEALIRDTREGMLYNSDFVTRVRGTGPVAKHVADTFRVFARRHGFERGPLVRMPTSFLRPAGEEKSPVRGRKRGGNDGPGLFDPA